MNNSKTYENRRRALAASLPADVLVIIPGARQKLRNGDSHYRFRQSSDFYYLTGFNEADALLLITGGASSRSILFNRPRNPLEERWNGQILGQENALAALGVDEAFSIESLKEKLPEYFSGMRAVYYPIGQDMGYETSIREAWREVRKKARRGQGAPEAFVDISSKIAALRLVKDTSEIESIRRATAISVEAHEAVMRKASTAQNEYELEAEFLYTLGRHGCRDVAYDPIVAGGPRACTLHYTANNQPLKADELLLIDAGGEVDFYAADITRTYPISGRFTPEQRAIYDLVLAAQKNGISCIKPGTPWDAIQAEILAVLKPGLDNLGLLKKGVTVQTFYMHSSGHWLGLDVHDAGVYTKDERSLPLEKNMVLTVEPGIYIAEDCDLVDEKWRGIGVRIEDDILVTDTGHENLTEALPVDPDVLESIIGGKL